MAAITTLNPKAEVARAAMALQMNTSAAKSLQEVLATNLGPKGTMKMLVSGAGDIKMTKDGNVLLQEMQIQHPTASLIARAATAQDDDTGDGTTSCVLSIGELLKQAEMFIGEGVHPRLIADGFELAKDEALKVLDEMKIKGTSREVLIQVARTSLRTKLDQALADHITEEIVDAVLTIQQDQKDKPVDLFMVEIMTMQHKTETETRLHKGIVLDHGARHPDMPKRLSNCYVLTCNASLEYEKTEVNAGFFYKTAERREKFAIAERKFIDDRVEKIIAFKKQVCGDDETKSFVVINQKGIDPISLEALAKEGIFAVRRAKRRNMERVTLSCGGIAMNSVDKLTVECLGHADEVYEHVLGEDKYTFIGGVKDPRSVTLLITGPNNFSINQIKDAVRDGLRAVNNAIIDQSVVPGAGAFEIRAHQRLTEYKKTVKGRARLGVQAFADALLVIPKTLARNAGFDAQDTIVTLQQAAQDNDDAIGLDINTGEECLPAEEGIFDNYRVKREVLQSCTMLATNLLIVDEVMRAGLSSLKQ